MNESRRRRIGGVFAALCLLSSATACAQAWPTKPVRLVVAFAAGSAADIIARAVGDALARSLGQTVIIENKPAAGGTIAAATIAKAAPDGHSLLIHSAGHVVNPAIYSNLPYDTSKDFAPVSPLAILPNLLVVPPSRFKSVQELVAAAKSSNGRMNYGSAGNGSATHINAEKFRASAGFDATHIPFKGTPEALHEVMAGRLDFLFTPIVLAPRLIREGRLIALAVGTAKRTALLPDMPTTVELGYVDSGSSFWIAAFAPARTPRDVIDRLNAGIAAALQSADIRDRFAALGAEPFAMKTAEFDAYVRAEIEASARIIRAAGIKAN